MSEEAMTPGVDTNGGTTGDTTGDTDGDADVVDGPADRGPLDLDRVERDLAGVEAALRRLDEGTYWTDEVTGEAIPDDVLAADPVTRRVG